MKLLTFAVGFVIALLLFGMTNLPTTPIYGWLFISGLWLLAFAWYRFYKQAALPELRSAKNIFQRLDMRKKFDAVNNARRFLQAISLILLLSAVHHTVVGLQAAKIVPSSFAGASVIIPTSTPRVGSYRSSLSADQCYQKVADKSGSLTPVRELMNPAALATSRQVRLQVSARAISSEYAECSLILTNAFYLNIGPGDSCECALFPLPLLDGGFLIAPPTDMEFHPAPKPSI